jgi:putative phage-type endonuclease
MDKIEWLTKRRTCVTATDIGAICEVSPYKSVFDVWYDKTNPKPPEEKKGNAALDWGTRLEPVIAQAYTDIVGIKLKKGEFFLKEINGIPCGCTPDYESEDGIINVEIKTANAKMEQWGNDGTDEVPEVYLTQTQWQMGLTGKKITHLPCLVFSRDMRTYNIHFDEEIFKYLLDRATNFWKYVVDKTPPPIDNSMSCRKYLTQLFKNGKKEIVPEPSTDLLKGSSQFFKISRVLNALESKKDELSNILLSQIGEYSGVKIDGVGKLTVVRGGEQEKIDYKSVVAALRAHVPNEIMESVIKANTKTSTKSSFLRAFFKGE